MQTTGRRPGGRATPGLVATAVLAVAGAAAVVPVNASAQDRSGAGWPAGEWPTADPGSRGVDRSKLETARDYALTAGGSGLVIHRGARVFSWGDQAVTYDLKSTSKSIGVTLLGVAIGDGRVQLDDRAADLLPGFGIPPAGNGGPDWLGRITLRMLADQTAGFAKPGGFEPLKFEPATAWSYSDGGPNWLADCLTHTYQRDLEDLAFERLLEPIGIGRDDLRWRKNQYRKEPLNGLERREFGSGIHANVDAMARIGYLYLREGRWDGQQLIPAGFVDAVRNPDPSLQDLPTRSPGEYGSASHHYSLLWWNNVDGTLEGVPRDAFWSWGLYDSLVVVVPSLDLVAARAGPARSWRRREGGSHYDVLLPFLRPLTGAFAGTRPSADPSPVIETITWAPLESIARLARGSDNWPITWGADGHLYTAYGDGRGFEPFTDRKLSLGFARVSGAPDRPSGTNIRTPTGESLGDGRSGKKASGLLAVGDVLYLLARNAQNAQLAWSDDSGVTWTWADWRFEESFGCPTFLNCGRAYAGARDGFAYVYSHDSGSAYRRADRFVMARVPRGAIKDREAYEFFVRTGDDGSPVWSGDPSERGAVFSRTGGCYRSSVSFNAWLGRYLWCQTGQGDDTRFDGGFRILDAPNPWGPWTVAFETDRWDTGPGESMHLPTKWISTGGTTVWLVFSGDDCFSVRRGDITLKRPP